jgi:Primase C terminal 1 (PriCT-1)
MVQDNLHEQARHFFASLLYPLAANERVEIRLKKPGEGQPMRRRFYADPVEAARDAVTLGLHEEVYAGVAPRLGENGTKASVTRLRALWADLDFKAGYTHTSRIKQLMELPHHHSILVWTGRGWHAYWLLQEPAEGPDELDRAEYIMRRIAESLQGDPVHDRSRILRVPGTFNWKYGEPRPVVIEHYHPDRRFGLEELEAMVETLPRKASDDPDNGGTVPRDVLSGPIREGQRNVALASVAGSLRIRGLDSETICSILLELNQRKCEPPLAKTEVVDIGRSIGRYPPGSPRYRKSSSIRVYVNRKESS